MTDLLWRLESRYFTPTVLFKKSKLIEEVNIPGISIHWKLSGYGKKTKIVQYIACEVS
jgi:hypothetical protein